MNLVHTSTLIISAGGGGCETILIDQKPVSLINYIKRPDAMALVGVNQVQRWTFSHWVRELREGQMIVSEHLSEIFGSYLVKARKAIRRKFERFKRRKEIIENSTTRVINNDGTTGFGGLETPPATGPPSSASSSSSLININGPPWQQAHQDDHQPTTLHYSFLLLAKMLNTTLLYIPAFGLSLRLGLAPSRLFVIFSYLSLVGFFALSMVLAKFTLRDSIEIFVGKMNKNLKQICSGTIQFTETGYFVFGLSTCGYILYQIQFLQNFIYHRCSIITLSRNYQRRQIIYLFLMFNTFAFLSEPLFGILALVYDIHQPEYWPHMSPTIFMVAKFSTIASIGCGAIIIGSSVALIPLMTCYLIVTTTKHLKNLVKKQVLRYNQITIWSRSDHNKDLEALLNSRTRKIMKDYACETLTMDWPDLIELSDEPESRERLSYPLAATASNWPAGIDQLAPVAPDGGGGGTILNGGAMLLQDGPTYRKRSQSRSGSRSCSSGKSFAIQNDTGGGLFGQVPHYMNQSSMMMQSQALASSKLSSSKASCLLFLYKNLIKNMSELKCMILDYERKFGNFHQVATLLSCLTLSFWVTSALTEARQASVTDVSGTDQAAGAAASLDAAVGASVDPHHDDTTGKRQKSAFTLRIIVSAICFILSNIFVFLKCDCLSDRIIKIKSQLFKMNIDLACTVISVQRKQQQLTQAPMTLATPIPRIKIHADLVETRPGAVYSSASPSGEFFGAEPSPIIRYQPSYQTGSIYEIDHPRGFIQQSQPEQYVNQCPELDQIWSLYDQVERISTKVNFKFTSETYYSKRCMLLVFGRAVSLILFFIQIIDMYSG